jgi:galactokinase
LRTSEGAAHGRVNLIGEHTDYNGGFVLPVAIPQKTHCRITQRPDRTVRATSRSEHGPREFTLGQEKRSGTWIDYVQGVTWVLAREGYTLSGFDLEIESSVPAGSGLSSSAALEVALLRALVDAFSLQGLDDMRIARLSQLLENEFVGARVGIMDPMAAALADERHALFVDTRDLSYGRIALPSTAMEILVIHSGVSHRNSAQGGYNQRRAECEEVCRRAGIAALRELSPGRLDALSLPEPLARRARHVVTENERVLAAVKALEEKDPERLGRLFVESHDSMRDDYEVSAPEVDRLVGIACADPAIYGARLTGGGFGGSIVALARPGHAAEAGARIVHSYGRSDVSASVLVPIER